MQLQPSSSKFLYKKIYLLPAFAALFPKMPSQKWRHNNFPNQSSQAMDSHFASLSVFLKKSRNVRRSELAICSTFDCCHFQNSMFISQNFSKFVILRIISFTHVPQHVSTHQPGQPSTLKVANPSTPPSTSTRSCASTVEISRRWSHFSHCTRRFGTWTQDVTTPWKAGNF